MIIQTGYFLGKKGNGISRTLIKIVLLKETVVSLSSTLLPQAAPKKIQEQVLLTEILKPPKSLRSHPKYRSLGKRLVIFGQDKIN